MKIFGKNWGDASLARCDVPMGAVCTGCGNAFKPTDLGIIMPAYGTEASALDVTTVAYHRGCLLRALGLAPATKPTAAGKA